MTKEELYEEFKKVTHFDDTGLDISISRFTKIELNDKQIANDFEGIIIEFTNPNLPPLTYFHRDGKDELIKLIDETYEDFMNSPGGEGWCVIDGKEYHTDMGYAYDGIEMFVEVLKNRMEANHVDTDSE